MLQAARKRTFRRAKREGRISSHWGSAPGERRTWTPYFGDKGGQPSRGRLAWLDLDAAFLDRLEREDRIVFELPKAKSYSIDLTAAHSAIHWCRFEETGA